MYFNEQQLQQQQQKQQQQKQYHRDMTNLLRLIYFYKTIQIASCFIGIRRIN